MEQNPTETDSTWVPKSAIFITAPLSVCVTALLGRYKSDFCNRWGQAQKPQLTHGMFLGLFGLDPILRGYLADLGPDHAKEISPGPVKITRITLVDH